MCDMRATCQQPEWRQRGVGVWMRTACHHGVADKLDASVGQRRQVGKQPPGIELDRREREV